MGGARGYSFEGIDVLVSLESLIVLVLHAVKSSTRNGTNLTSKGSLRGKPGAILSRMALQATPTPQS